MSDTIVLEPTETEVLPSEINTKGASLGDLIRGSRLPQCTGWAVKNGEGEIVGACALTTALIEAACRDQA